MKRRLLFLVGALAAFSLASNAQDVEYAISNIEAGWGWGCTYTYGATNPGTTAGVGCSSSIVTQIAVETGAQFSLVNLTSVSDWTKYGSIELLVYADAAARLSGDLKVKGWLNSKQKNIEATMSKAVDTTWLVAGEWQVLEIDLTKEMLDDTNSTIKYTSFSDTSLNASSMMFTVELSGTSANLYVGSVLLKKATMSGDVNIPLSAVRNGWGWNNAITHNVTNPGTTAGVGCSESTVTKVAVSSWCGSFGIQDTTGAFSWSSITDWTNYEQLELLVYPSITCSFNDSLQIIGYYNENVVIYTGSSIETKNLTANEWQTLTIDLSSDLVSSAGKTYSSLGDTIGLSLIQLKRIALSAETGDLYIGKITLKDKTLTSAGEIKDQSGVVVYPNPASSSAIVSFEAEENSKISVISLSGVEVATAIAKAGTSETSIDVSKLAPGLYIVSVKTADAVVSKMLNVK